MQRRYRRHPEAVWREEVEGREAAERGLEAGEDVSSFATSVLLLSGKVLSLNVVGTEVWKRCDGRTLDDLVADLAVVFEVEPSELRADLEAFLADLDRAGFLDAA